ncbi:MAG: serine/threonine-protein kinase [Anaeromyxobacter sp.]
MAFEVPGYALQELIGRGGMAEVHRATVTAGPHVGRNVAVKQLLPELARDADYLALFEREAELTRRLQHPAIVEVLDAGVAGGVPFIAMEYVDGRNLKEILAVCAARHILLPIDFACYLAHQLAGALAHAHEGRDAQGRALGVVHCDVSPSNVFISRLGEIELGDFGVALPTGAGPLPGGAFGKIRYLAPEQILGRRPGPPADVFALGSVFFELLTNAHAFPGKDVNEVGQRILAGKLRAPSSVRPEIPAALDVLLLRSLDPEPAGRPTAAAFAAEIAGGYDPAVGTPLAIAAVVRGLFGAR